MADIISASKKLSVEETQFRAFTSGATGENPATDAASIARKIGGSLNLITDADRIAPGIMYLYAGHESTVPIGWVICDGRPLLISSYPDLYAAIGTRWGQPDPTRFYTPDLRGMFPRMVDTTSEGSAGKDPNASTRVAYKMGGASGDNVGSYQGDVYKYHTHKYYAYVHGSGITAGNDIDETDYFSNFSLQTEGKGGNETRGKNVYILVIIKA